MVKRGASIGTGATILPNTCIGENAIVGAGSVVTRDVPANAIIARQSGKSPALLGCIAEDKVLNAGSLTQSNDTIDQAPAGYLPLPSKLGIVHSKTGFDPGLTIS